MRLLLRPRRWSLRIAAFAGSLFFVPDFTLAQQNGGQQQQGSAQGVLIDSAGVLRKRKVSPAVARFRADQTINGQLTYVSLPKLFAEFRKLVESGEEIPEQMRYLDGLVKIRFLCVDRENGDVLIAGHAESWDLSDPFRPRGTRTGRPVLQLDDLIVALRHLGPGSSNRIFGCTLLQDQGAGARIAEYQRNLRPIVPAERGQAAEALRRALGDLNAEYYGLPADNRFALVSVEADYMMKRLALGLDRMPAKGLKAHLLERLGGSLMNRFWFVPNYEPIAMAEDGSAYELRGPGLKVLASDSPTTVGTSNPAAEQFAADFSRLIGEIEDNDPVYADLHNLTDLAIITALIAEDRLAAEVGWDLAWILDPRYYSPPKMPAPTKAAAIVNYQNHGGVTILVAGGVEMKMDEVIRGRVAAADLSPLLLLRPQLAVDQWSGRVDEPAPPEKSRRGRVRGRAR